MYLRQARLEKFFGLATFFLLITAAIATLILTVEAASASPPPPPDCSKSSLTKEKFIAMLHTLVEHKDFMDVQFIEKTLQTKFNSHHGYDALGNPDPESFIYQADSMSGTPIDVDLGVDNDPKKQQEIQSMGFLRISNEWGSRQFLTTCLHISASELANSFGDIFSGGDAIPDSFLISTTEKKFGKIGKNKSIISLIYNYSTDTKIVDGITFKQQP